jgi:hypothetical protein
MKCCYLHIGMPKTGSTSIQMNLFQVGNPTGWRILTVGGSPNMGTALFAMFSTKYHHTVIELGRTPELIARRGKRWRGKLAKAIRQSTEETIIISGEAMHSMEESGIVALRDFLRPLCDEIRVIGYVRPPMGYKMSSFQQRVKSLRKCSFDMVTAKLKYRRKFEKFDEIFGRENVLLRKFDPSSFPNSCIVTDFCGQLGIDGPDLSKVQRMNESLSREACGILYAFRKFGPGFGIGVDVLQQNKQILAPLLAMSGEKFKVSKSLVALAPDEEKDLKWMENRLGTSLHENIEDDGTAVASEEDLLHISAGACREFAGKFSEIYGIEIPEAMIPSGSPVVPNDVADMVEYCRGLLKQRIHDKRFLRRVPASLRKSWNFTMRLLGKPIR